MFKKIASKYDKKVNILGYTNKVPELMAISDFVISKPGGLTTTEILASNVPFIIINPIPGQEEENARFLLNNGAAVRLYDAEKTTPFLNKLLNDEKRIDCMKEMQRHIARPNSTRDIVEIILRKILIKKLIFINNENQFFYLIILLYILILFQPFHQISY